MTAIQDVAARSNECFVFPYDFGVVAHTTKRSDLRCGRAQRKNGASPGHKCGQERLANE
jgi:hypothetical protein